jgi:hypothetical protein
VVVKLCIFLDLYYCWHDIVISCKLFAGELMEMGDGLPLWSTRKELASAYHVLVADM